MEAMHKPNLLELCTSPAKGGLELYYANISNQLQEYFHVVNVISSHSQVEANIGTAHPVLKLNKKAHYFPIIAALKLAKIIDDYGIHVVHMHWNKDLTLLVLAKLLSKSRPKIVLTRHMQFPARKDSFFHRFLYQHIDHIIAITKTMENDLKRFIPQDVQPEISVNYLGIQPLQPSAAEVVKQVRKPYDPDSNKFLIGLFGRIDPYKGPDLLIDALVMAKQQQLPFKALIVGHAMTESYLESLKKRVSQHQLEDYLIFTGFVENPRELMQACDTVILTTIEETFGLVLIEAMSMGVPVIGSNRGGVPEIIEHQQTGLLFESGDSQELFKALLFLYQHPVIAQDYAKKALATVQVKFSAQRHLDRLVKCLTELSRGK